MYQGLLEVNDRWSYLLLSHSAVRESCDTYLAFANIFGTHYVRLCMCGNMET